MVDNECLCNVLDYLTESYVIFITMSFLILMQKLMIMQPFFCKFGSEIPKIF